jgi:hypothetical protein
MHKRICFVFVFLALAAPCVAQTVVEVQEVKEPKPTGSLGTCSYGPTEKESAFLKKLAPAETVTGSFMDKHPYKLQGKNKQFVSWFGVLRGATEGESNHTYNLLIEQKYFDGMTDCHIMLVSNAGAGDFVATARLENVTIPDLSLVRVYGTVSEEKDGLPYLLAEYIRVWPWFTFTFTDLGPADHGNPRWAKYCKRCKSGHIYNPYPAEGYYMDMLGDPKEFGTMLGKQSNH